MNKIQEASHKVKTFADEVGGEMRKTTWPERHELLGSTLVVIVSVILLSAFVGLSDKLLMTLLRMLLARG